MTGTLDPAHHKTLGPVLIAAYLNGTPEPFAIVFSKTGLIRKVKISELSADWHYDEATGQWQRDFSLPQDEESGQP